MHRDKSSPVELPGPEVEEKHTVAGGTVTTARGAWLESGGAVAFEDTLEEESSRRPTTGIVARLFQEGEDPQLVDVQALPDLIRDDRNFVWVDLSEYVEDDLRRVSELAGIHSRVTRLLLASWQRPRVDVFTTHFFASVTLADVDWSERRVRAHEVDLIVGDNLLISAHKRALPFGTRLVSRAQSDPDLVRLDAAFMLYIILDQMLDHYDGLRERLEGEIEALQEEALSDSSDSFLQDIVELKRAIFAVTQLVQHHRTVFDAFLRPDFPFVSGDEVEDYFHLLGARLARLLDQLDAARAEVNSAFDIYVSHESHRTNVQMKLLTIVATLLLPANVILSFFGTQFRTVPIHTPLMFVLMLASIGVTTALTLVFFRRRGML